MPSPDGRSHRHLATAAIEAVAAVALFGCIPVAVKHIHANAWTVGIVRLAIATGFTIVVVAVRGGFARLPRRDLLRLIVIGFLFFVHWITYFISIKTASAAIATIGLSTYGVDLLILGAIAGHGRIRLTDAVAVLFAVAGAVIVVPPVGGSGAAIGLVLALISAFFYATLPILHQRWDHIPNSLRTLGQFGFALLFFLLFLPKSNWDLNAVDWAGLLFLGIGATLIAHTLWVRVTTSLSPAAASIVYYGNVPFAVVLSFLVLHEPLTWRTVGGALLIIAGGVIGLVPQLMRRRAAIVAPEV